MDLFICKKTGGGGLNQHLTFCIKWVQTICQIKSKKWPNKANMSGRLFCHIKTRKRKKISFGWAIKGE